MYLNRSISRQDTVVLLDLINKSAFCTNEQDYHHLMCGMKALIPYENAFSILGKREHHGDMTYHAVAINCSIRGQEGTPGLCDHHDAVMKKKFAQFPVHHWEDIFDIDPLKKNIVSIVYDAEKNHAFTHDAKAPDDGIQGSVFSLSGRNVKQVRRTEGILSLAVPHLHYALMRALRRSRNTKDGLTLKEKEVLKWLRLGKSTWDISVLLGISERTVKFHVSNIMQKLNVSNRTHAVAISIEQGIVTTA